MTRRFRFGLQLTTEHETEPIETAKRAETLGFDVVLIADHIGLHPSPMPLLAAIAAQTDSIRLGTFVLNNDMRNPVQLAWEASTLDQLSGGRFELGIGAGHTPHEYAETGIDYQPAAVRKRRLSESTGVLRRLLDGESVDFDGEFYSFEGATVPSPTQQHLPIMVAGNGAGLLGHAGATADIVGLNGLGRRLEDGHRHQVKFSPEWLDTQIEQIRAGAGDRFDDLELNALVQMATITEDGAKLREEVAARVEADPAHLTEIPYVLVGTVEEIADQITRCRDRWGITYFGTRTLEDFAPVIELLR